MVIVAGVSLNGGGMQERKLETAEAAMRPFDIKAIERDLSELWRDDRPQKRALTRACVINLLVYDEIGDSGLAETIIDITKHHPGRVLLMRTRPNSLTDSLQAEVSSVCQFLPSKGKQICSEQVTVVAEGAAVLRLAATVRPLLVSDLPVVLWWRGVPADIEPFAGLVEASDKVVIDTGYLPRPTAYLPVIADMVGSRVFSDLTWSRLTGLRSHIAGLYDLPDLGVYVWDISRVVIEYPAETSDRELPAPQPLFLLGWLAYRLGWSAPEFLRPHIFRMWYEGREISAEFIASSGMTGDDLRITLTMTDHTGWQEARLAVARTAQTIETKLETPTICWLRDIAKYERPSEAVLLVRELELLGRDTTYENVLRFAANLVNLM